MCKNILYVFPPYWPLGHVHFVCVRVFPTQCVDPLELSVRDEQFILTTVAGGERPDCKWLEDLTTTLFR